MRFRLGSSPGRKKTNSDEKTKFYAIFLRRRSLTNLAEKETHFQRLLLLFLLPRLGLELLVDDDVAVVVDVVRRPVDEAERKTEIFHQLKKLQKFVGLLESRKLVLMLLVRVVQKKFGPNFEFLKTCRRDNFLTKR